jgi:hypothetical protein
MRKRLIYKDIGAVAEHLKRREFEHGLSLIEDIERYVSESLPDSTATIACLNSLRVKILASERQAAIVSSEHNNATSDKPEVNTNYTDWNEYRSPNGCKQTFGIACFGYASPARMKICLDAIKKNGGLGVTHVWIDGDQGNWKIMQKIDKTEAIARSFSPFRVIRRRGNYGFRRTMFDALTYMSSNYKTFLLLEDDCLLAEGGLNIFLDELSEHRDNSKVLTVYGSHFKLECEFPFCTRFQGWGWATWSEKIIPFILQMKRLYLLDELSYLRFIESALTEEVKTMIDVTKGREASRTLRKFFAWDETLALLSALESRVHRPTCKRSIYNYGMDFESSHFPENDRFRKPPFNMITPQEAQAMLLEYR